MKNLAIFLAIGLTIITPLPSYAQEQGSAIAPHQKAVDLSDSASECFSSALSEALLIASESSSSMAGTKHCCKTSATGTCGDGSAVTVAEGSEKCTGKKDSATTNSQSEAMDRVLKACAGKRGAGTITYATTCREVTTTMPVSAPASASW